MDRYDIDYDGEWLASFATNGETSRYCEELLRGRSILGNTYTDPHLFQITKDGQVLTFDVTISVCIGGY